MVEMEPQLFIEFVFHAAAPQNGAETEQQIAEHEGLLRAFEHLGHGRGKGAPIGLLDCELLPPGARQLVIPRAAVVLGCAPRRF